MRKLTGTVLAAGVAVVCLWISTPAGAVSYEDSLEDCAYPRMFDVAVLRPLSFLSMVTGFGLFTGFGPIAAATVGGEVGQVWDGLVASPARFTFRRPLGECEGVDLSY